MPRRLIQSRALPICDRRLTRAEAWLAHDPRDREAQSYLIAFLAERAAILAELGRRAEALKDVDRSFAVGDEVYFPGRHDDESGPRGDDPADGAMAAGLGSSPDQSAFPSLHDRPASSAPPGRVLPATIICNQPRTPIEPSSFSGRAIDCGFRQDLIAESPDSRFPDAALPNSGRSSIACPRGSQA